MAPRITNEVLAVQIRGIQEDVTEIKADVKTINGSVRGHDSRLAVVETTIKIMLGVSGVGGVAYAGLRLLG